MSGSIWMIKYDVRAEHEERYLDWFHNVHMPEKLARPGYTWAAHYEVITSEGHPRSLLQGAAAREQRGFVALFGGNDTRAFLNPSPAQIKPTQPPLTREMMSMRVGSSMLIAAEEWRMESESGGAASFEFLTVSICDVADNDEDYGAWCIQTLAPHWQSSVGFEAATKMLSATNAAKHIAVASFASLETLRACENSMPDNDWTERVQKYRQLVAGGPLWLKRVA